ncbi:MAG: peptide chain release factor 2 [Candidatus Enteromonas sp.]|nr:peptide chain release factor 2 [bacterium]MDY6100683.1 peptide chain release factor 2 [Candidatus Enteromonas sp.]
MKELVELKQNAQDLGEVVSHLGDSLDLDSLKKEIAELEERQNQEDFWNDQNAAMVVVNRLADIRGKVNGYEKAVADLNDINELLSACDEKDSEMIDLVESMEADLEKSAKELRSILLFSGEYDSLNCTLDIHPGAGGTEAQDWSSMLLRMYGRWCERHNFKCQVLSLEDGDEAGIKSVTIKITGHNAYGMLKGEKGVHRLVRISPFDANARRHTSFSSVNVVPEFGPVADVVIDPKDLRIDIFRSGGAGGQNVNKVSSAVRITHIPTGIVVSSEAERDQPKNKANCMAMLRDKLMQKKVEEREAKMRSIIGVQKDIEWGSQIRSYVFQPYQMVKDHRTDAETGNVQAVMDGDIDLFIYAYLEMEAKNADAQKVVK